MKVSIVTYHTALDELTTVLEALRSPEVDGITIIDNGSEKRIEDFCRSREGVEYIASENVGYGAGHNIALRRSLAEGEKYHLVINSDLQFAPEILEKMRSYMDAHPDIGVLHPRILGPDGNDQFTVRMLPTPADLIIRRFLPRWMFRRRRDRYLLKHLDHDREFDVQYMQGSFMLLRVEALREVGLFDERFFMYPEDIDLTRRIAEKFRATYFPEVRVVHAHRAESYHSLRMTWIHITNMVRYFRKWRRKGWR